jgi:hypothetical protein
MKNLGFEICHGSIDNWRTGNEQGGIGSFCPRCWAKFISSFSKDTQRLVAANYRLTSSIFMHMLAENGAIIIRCSGIKCDEYLEIKAKTIAEKPDQDFTGSPVFESTVDELAAGRVLVETA